MTYAITKVPTQPLLIAFRDPRSTCDVIVSYLLWFKTKRTVNFAKGYDVIVQINSRELSSGVTTVFFMHGITLELSRFRQIPTPSLPTEYVTAFSGGTDAP